MTLTSRLNRAQEKLRVLYAAGPGDVIGAHQKWMKGERYAHEVAITYSGQFADFCRDTGAEAYIVSSHTNRAIFRDGPFTLEHRPRTIQDPSGVLFHLVHLHYALSLLITALRFRVHVAVISSGTTHYFALILFRLFGIRVITVLHNSLWPAGFPPTRPLQQLILWLDSLFFRYASSATLGISPECIRQVRQIDGGKGGELREFRNQFRREDFADVPPPPPLDRTPFGVLFAARIVRNKGVFDILDIAQRVQARAPGRARWDICGAGPDLEDLKSRHADMGLGSIVRIHGWTPPDRLRVLLAESHAVIVPTRGDFAEGMTKSMVEGILTGRPAITSRVVPALEVLGSASLAAEPEDVGSYADAVLRLSSDASLYETLCAACEALKEPFFDRKLGFSAVLKDVIRGIK